MEKKAILAHRGDFRCNEEKNTENALMRALEAGFGIETDLRDFDNTVCISHDPININSRKLELCDLLKFIIQKKCPGRIALNIKSDGLASEIGAQIRNSGLDKHQYFAFDMSIPDTISYKSENVRFYSRDSEYEQAENIKLLSPEGVWIDNFSGHYDQIEAAMKFVSEGVMVAIVSSELHQRDHIPLWKGILQSGLHDSPLVELCTDYPHDAAKTFASSK